jgi:hypothetical protein
MFDVSSDNTHSPDGTLMRSKDWPWVKDGMDRWTLMDGWTDGLMASNNGCFHSS